VHIGNNALVRRVDRVSHSSGGRHADHTLCHPHSLVQSFLVVEEEAVGSRDTLRKLGCPSRRIVCSIICAMHGASLSKLRVPLKRYTYGHTSVGSFNGSSLCWFSADECSRLEISKKINKMRGWALCSPGALASWHSTGQNAVACTPTTVISTLKPPASFHICNVNKKFLLETTPPTKHVRNASNIYLYWWVTLNLCYN